MHYYCVRCGVKLADSETVCPLCKTKVYHPEITVGEGEQLYPKKKYPGGGNGAKWVQGVLITLFLLPMLIVLLCDLQYSGRITWQRRQ